MNHLGADNWKAYYTSSMELSSEPRILMDSKNDGNKDGKASYEANLEDGIHPSRDFHAFSQKTGVQCSSETISHFQSDDKHNYVTDPKKAYLELIPLINKITRNNYWGFIITVLKKCSHQVPLDEFYKLLFNADKNKGSERLLKIHKSGSTPFEKEGLQLCHYIIQTFSCTWNDIKPFASGYVTNSLLSTIELKDFRRAFLAAKIMFDTISKSEDSIKFSRCILRSDVHRLYIFICEKLMNNYLVNGNIRSNKDLVMGHSHLGKILRLKYPNITSIRIGRRGDSKYHYLGISWNRRFIDEEIVNMLHLEECEKPRDLKFTKKTVSKASQISMNKPQEEVNSAVTNSAVTNFPVTNFPVTNLPVTNPAVTNPAITNSPITNSPNLSKYPIHSFVERSSKYPGHDFSPRSWSVVPGKVPERSKWVDLLLLKAASTLETYGIDVSNLIENFTVDMFSERFLLTFTEEFIRSLAILKKRTSQEEGYLHLYLVVLLLIFPVILSDNKEVSLHNRSQLRTNMEEFVARMNIELQMLKVEYPHFLIIVTNVVQKMIHINDLALARVRSTSAKDIVKGFFGHMDQPSEGQLSLPDGFPPNAGSCFQGVYTARSAFEHFLRGGPNGDFSNNEMKTKITDSFKRFCLSKTSAVLKIRESITEDDLKQPFYDLPVQLLKASLPVLHSSCLSDPWITQLPIQEINFILLQINKELQNISFKDSGKGDLKLVKETAETWRIYSSAIEEYLIVFSEISGLAGHLFEQKSPGL